MKINLKNYNYLNFAKYIILAFGISVLLFLLLPVSYYLFHQEIYKMIQSKKTSAVKVETIKIQEKKKDIKQIEKREKTKLIRPRTQQFTRFNLDLSVMSGEGGSGGVMQSGFGTVIEEGEADVPPIKRIFIPPKYPSRAREEDVEGKVVAKLLIDENGDVISVRILKEPRHWGFGSAVIEAAQKWKFEPAKLNNLPVKVWATQVIEFKL
ncbi:MAG: energy transducer TonB [Spirochaetes bacterium]|nr:energy transducer TonB [Spirochaetota bacterium]